MKIGFSAEDEAFRQEVASWLAEHLRGPYEALRFRGGPGDEHMFPEERKPGSASWPAAAGSASAGRAPSAGAACR